MKHNVKFRRDAEMLWELTLITHPDFMTVSEDWQMLTSGIMCHIADGFSKSILKFLFANMPAFPYSDTTPLKKPDKEFLSVSVSLLYW